MKKNARSTTVTIAILSVFTLGVFMAAEGCGNDGNTTPVADAGVVVKPITQDEVLQGCVRLHACGIQKHPRLVDCFNNFYNRHVRFGQRQLFQSMYRCANEAKGECGKIRQCLGFARKPKACTRTYAPRCDGDVAYNCDLLAKWEHGVDCALGGLKCAVKDSGTSKAAICGGGTCNSGKFKNECRDNKLFQCTGGALEITDCPEYNLQCRDSKSGSCEGRGLSCPLLPPKCDGNKLVTCEGGYFDNLDCGTVYGKKSCDSGALACTGNGKECSSDGTVHTCNGDKLEVCIDGYKQAFDCKAMGFLSCHKDALGASCKAEPIYE